MSLNQAKNHINKYVNYSQFGRYIGRFKIVMVHDDGDVFLLDKQAEDWFQVDLKDIFLDEN
tara:strand:+ start:241 stop:423 length:183 start_codon:yes stop_codon:yes gene_type:complete